MKRNFWLQIQNIRFLIWQFFICYKQSLNNFYQNTYIINKTILQNVFQMFIVTLFIPTFVCVIMATQARISTNDITIPYRFNKRIKIVNKTNSLYFQFMASSIQTCKGHKWNHKMLDSQHHFSILFWHGISLLLDWPLAQKLAPIIPAPSALVWIVNLPQTRYALGQSLQIMDTAASFSDEPVDNKHSESAY